MKRRSRILLATAALVALPLAQPMAADYDPPIYIDDAPEYVPVEIGSGWYLRGDIGYNFSTDTGDFGFRTYDPVAGTYGSDEFDTARLSDDFTWGLGFGYHFSDFLRADLTFDGFQSQFTGTTADAAPCAGGLAGTTCRSEARSRGSALAFMANGYIDLGTYAGFTPYVGAGAGVAYVDWSTVNRSFYCVDGGVACPAPGPAAVGTSAHPGETDWRFTYAFMAGLAWDISHNLKLDIGYRYRNIGDGEMFGWNDADTAAGATGVQGSDGGFETHEVRVGLRYDLW